MSQKTRRHAFEPAVCTTRVGRDGARRRSRRETPYSQELPQCQFSDGGPRGTTKLFQQAEPSLPYAVHQRRYSGSTEPDFAANERDEQCLAAAYKDYNAPVLRRPNEEQAGSFSHSKYDRVRCSPRHDRAESNRRDVLDEDEMTKLRRILKQVSKTKSHKVKAKRTPEKHWNKREKTMAALASRLSDFIGERREEAQKHPVKIQINSEKPPVLVLVLEGVISSPYQIDDLIEKDIMDKHVRGNTDYFENNMQVVIDLRGLRDIYSYAFECNAFRWGPYLNVRAKHVVLVLPRGKVLDQLKSLALEHDLPRIMSDVSWKIVYRSRDVHDAL